MYRYDVPRHLDTAVLKVHSAFPTSPVALFIRFCANLASLRRIRYGEATSYRGEAPIGVKDDEMEFEVFKEIELHFGQLSIICWKGLNTIALTKGLKVNILYEDLKGCAPENTDLASVTTTFKWTGISSAFAAT